MILGLSPYFAFLGLAIIAYLVYWLFDTDSFDASLQNIISTFAMNIARVLTVIQIIVWVVGLFKWIWVGL